MIWFLIAKVCAHPRVAEYLIRRAQKTPYFDLPGYMNRWWLFNAFKKHEGVKSIPYPWLPSIRIHHILRADLDRHFHDHPWNVRTFILKGWYREQRPTEPIPHMLFGHDVFAKVACYERQVGDTATLNYGEYHRITQVSPGGVWTLFISYKYRGTWGFWVDGKKVPWREYEGSFEYKVQEPTP